MNPPQQQINNLLELYQNKKYEDAKKLAVSLTKKFPKHQFTWKVLCILLKKIGTLSESLEACQKCVQLDPKDSEVHTLLGITLKALGRFKEAELSYNKAIKLKPDYFVAHNNLGNTLQELQRLEEAEESFNKAIKLKPDYAQAHYNLGNTLKKFGKLEEAEESFNKAIKLKPDYFVAHNNLGNALNKLGRLEEAEESYNRAIKLKPDYAEAYNNLGSVLKKFGRLEEEIAAYFKAIILKPNFIESKINLCAVIKNTRFNSSIPNIYPVLINLLTNENFIRPIDISSNILSLLKQDPLIKDLLSKKNITSDLKEVHSVIEVLNKLPLLHHLTRLCPIPDLQLERLFVMLRKVLLKNLNEIIRSSEIIYFLSTLSLHCFINEYIFIESDEEIELINDLEIKITQYIDRGEQPKLLEVLCFAAYRPLHSYDWCEKLKTLDQLNDIKTKLIEEPLTEKVLKEHISILSVIKDKISHKVKEQYEENPYPRWTKLYIPQQKQSIAELIDGRELKLYSEKIRNIANPKILIAGCGTGQQAIETASFISGCKVTAVDLSLASLAYAKRKTNELGLDNINYLQADILNLHELDTEFDVIQCVGVLHHMDKPMVGLKALRDLLKSSGLMEIGLYSELARSTITKIKEKITLPKERISINEIRKFRGSLMDSTNKDYQQLTNISDFYSMSEFRDLLFHVMEHRFNLLKIRDNLDKLGLKFCGFKNRNIILNFKKFYGEGSDIYDLALWNEFEKRNPFIFLEMYQFWCQRI